MGSYYIMEADDTEIQIYDMDSDDWHTLTKPQVEDASKKLAGLRDAKGNNIAPSDAQAVGGEGAGAGGAVDPVADAYNKVYTAGVEKAKNPAEMTSLMENKGIDTTDEDFVDAVYMYEPDTNNATGKGDASVTTTASERYLIVRPWAQYEMSSVIYAKAGAELGQTFHGHAGAYRVSCAARAFVL